MVKKSKRARVQSAHTRLSSTPAPTLYSSKLSSWFIATEEHPATRRRAERLLREGVKLIRRLYAGFEPSAGYNLRYLKHWPDSRVEAVRRYMAEANRLTSGEFYESYSLARPRTQEQRRALQRHTSQVSIDEQHHPQRAYVLYTNTRRIQTRYIKERVLMSGFVAGIRPRFEERLRVEIRRPARGVTLVYRDYSFREVLGFQPGVESTSTEGLRVARSLGVWDPWSQLVAAMQMLLRYLPYRTSKGDEAHYRLLSDRGPIGTSVPRHMLMERMQTWGEEYNQKFAALLIGVRYQGNEFEAIHGPDSADKQSLRRRARYQQYVKDRWRAQTLLSGALSSLKRKAMKRMKMKAARTLDKPRPVKKARAKRIKGKR